MPPQTGSKNKKCSTICLVCQKQLCSSGVTAEGPKEGRYQNTLRHCRVWLMVCIQSGLHFWSMEFLDMALAQSLPMYFGSITSAQNGGFLYGCRSGVLAEVACMNKVWMVQRRSVACPQNTGSICTHTADIVNISTERVSLTSAYQKGQGPKQMALMWLYTKNAMIVWRDILCPRS